MTFKSNTFNKDYAKYYDLFNQGKDYNNEVNFLEKVFKKFGDNKVKSILDLGCGTGLHTKELIKRGYQITGIDLSAEMIEIAKKRNPKAKFIISDISNFNLSDELNEKFDVEISSGQFQEISAPKTSIKKQEVFDVIICMFSVLGYLTENIQLENFFKCCKFHLKENGLLILDVWNGLAVMNELPSSREKIVEIKELNLKIVRTSFPTLDAKNHINNVKFVVKVFELSSNKLITEYEEAHKVRFFFPLELKRYMEDAGFKLIHLCPSFELNQELNEDNWNMIVVGRLNNKQ